MTYPVTFDQPTEVDYCPYCNNRFPLDWMSDEHVIPEVIGGDQRSVIQARKPCNNYMGARVDSALARHSYVRILALIKGLSKKSPNHVEKHPSQARLKNGTWLDGYCFVHFPTATTWQ